MDEVTRPSAAQEFQRQLGVLVEDADYCLNAARERKGSDQLHSLLAPVVEAVLFDAGDVIDEIAAGEVVSSADDELLERHSIPTLILRVRNVAKSHLGKVERLDPETSNLGLITTCNVAVGTLKSAVIELEIELSFMHGVPPTLTFAPMVEKGLNLRKHFARFDRAIAGLHPLENRIELATRLFENFRGSRYWSNVRVRDQLHCQAIHETLIAAGDGRDEPPKLWESVRSFARDLRLVTRRSELVEHDLELIEATLESALSKSVSTPIDESFLKRVEPLRYIFDDVEDLFQRGSAASFGEWKFALETTRDRLAGPLATGEGTTTTEMPAPGDLST